jgi:hypothetical protein
VRGRYVQDVDTDGPGSVTDVRWDVNTGNTLCPKSAVCVYVALRLDLSCSGYSPLRIIEECRV